MDRTSLRSPRKTRSVAVMKMRWRILIFLSLRSVANLLECTPTVLCASSKMARSNLKRAFRAAAYVDRTHQGRQIASASSDLCDALGGVTRHPDRKRLR